MKKIVLGALLALSAAACDDRLDFTPKGQTTLNTLADLELLLNQNWGLDTPISSLCVVCNEAYGYAANVINTYEQKNTVEYAMLFYDENVDRAALTTTDANYAGAYRYINYMNVLLDKIDDVEGSEAEKAPIAAEAHIMRAYMHWLLVNMYARQYDAATAAEDGGIPYVTDIDVTAQKTKLIVQQVYDNILVDCADEYINALPDQHDNVTRGDKAWGNAVRAKVLMQMKRYDEALPYALTAISYNDNLQDRSTILQTNDWVLEERDPSNYVFIDAGMMSPFCEVLSLESADCFEEGDYVNDYAYMMGMAAEGNECWNTSMGEMTSGIPGTPMCYGMSANVNNYGITADRMHYTAAECYIRTGQIDEGLDLVNQVRQLRIHPDNYQPFTATTEAEAMTQLQRAKWIECIATYENFFDCKRWNTEENYRRTITRTIPDLGTFTLAPDSPLWIFPFPANAVRYNSSLTQNY